MNDIELQEKMSTMDIPEMRRDVSKLENLNWLKNNLGIRNSTHPNFTLAWDEILVRWRAK